MKILCLIFLLAAISNQLDWSNVQKQLQKGVAQGYFTGCALSVININDTLYQKQFGFRQYPRGLFAPKITIDSMFDINSLTEVVGINTIMMRFYDRLRLNYTQLVRLQLPEFNNNNKSLITIQQLMLHNSGLQADLPTPLPKDPATLLSQIYNVKLTNKSEVQFLYSNLDFIILGQMLRKMDKNQTLQSTLFQIFVEMGMRDTIFNPDPTKYQFVPGGILDGPQIGKTFNKYAHILNGQTGSAGLFSNIKDMTTFMQVMLNKGSTKAGSRVFTEKVVGQFTTRFVFTKYKNTRALGWDTIPSTNPPCGSKFSANSFGLADAGGSYLWADKTKNIAIIFLANGNFPTAKSDISKYQGNLSDEIMKTLGY